MQKHFAELTLLRANARLYSLQHFAKKPFCASFFALRSNTYRATTSLVISSEVERSK